ncbi:nucleolar complex protein 2 homolog isoform X2 [Myripristis murdjan]|uniref:nucleolar complex protein 2 homolog isoform X2 n=1 Tax=Myripristis murdjan TaxID=586833 RepID=UPI001176288B|nr:nucleolar complex protein 2 homolog isoform X2 [Myripristis murdjan]
MDSSPAAAEDAGLTRRDDEGNGDARMERSGSVRRDLGLEWAIRREQMDSNIRLLLQKNLEIRREIRKLERLKKIIEQECEKTPAIGVEKGSEEEEGNRQEAGAADPEGSVDEDEDEDENEAMVMHHWAICKLKILVSSFGIITSLWSLGNNTIEESDDDDDEEQDNEESDETLEEEEAIFVKKKEESAECLDPAV